LFFQLPLLPELIGRLQGKTLLRRMLTEEPVRKNAYAEEQIAAYQQLALHPATGINYYRASFRSGPWRHVLATVTVPVLILWGDRDRHLLPFLAGVDSSWASTVTVRHYDVSHWIHNDIPQDVNEEILRFVEGDFI
jgi:pimeloyl-ACP methyl ester carboxylesterase